MAKVCIDTNVLLSHPEVLDLFEDILLSSAVLEEVDKLKMSKDVGHLAREANRKLEENIDRIQFDATEWFPDMPVSWDSEKNDNRIVMSAFMNGCKLISNDINVRVKGKSLGLVVEGYGDGCKTVDSDYCGYKVVESHEDVAKYYEKTDTFGLKNGQYLIVRNLETQEVIEKVKFVNGEFKKIKYKAISTRAMGKINPLNLEQELLFDLLQDETKTIFTCFGRWGSGKDFCMLAHAFNMIERKKFDRLIFCRNNIEVKNSKEVGFLKGSLEDKLMPYAQVMADHLGGQIGLDMLIDNGTIELQHLGFLRGRTITNSIIYITEAENLTREHVQLLIARVGEGSIIMFNGDFKQIDSPIFNNNNGLHQIIERLSGNELFGVVKLDKCERSKTARLADLLD